jgi:LAO/AO transport system kinase
MEVADIIAVNKADGMMEQSAHSYRASLENNLKINRRRYDNWLPPVVSVSAKNKMNLDLLWEKIKEFRLSMESEIYEKR